MTLGTSAVARQSLTKPALDLLAGTFCYRAAEDAYILGCAGSNGGNVLDWGRLRKEAPERGILMHELAIDKTRLCGRLF